MSRDLLWLDDPVALADCGADVVVELIGGEEGPARALVETALGAGKHVVTANKALLAHHGAALAALAEEDRRGAQIRGGRRRRHSDRQGAARKPDRLWHRRGARHSQRHLQLHPHPDGSDGPLLRRRAGRGAAAWASPKPIRRSMSAAATPRTSWRCCRASPSASCPILEHIRTDRHRAHHAGRHRLRARVRIPHQAAGRGAAHGRMASTSACSRPWCAPGTPLGRCRRRLQRRGRRCRRGGPVLLRRPRRRRGAHGLGGDRRSGRYCARRQRPGVRPAGGEAAAADRRRRRTGSRPFICASRCWTCRACWPKSPAGWPNRRSRSKA